MEYRKLGHSDIDVSLLCLGTMTWGNQNTEAEAHAQLDYALDHGVNFLDAAEMYPIPPTAETQGRTEAYIGAWLADRGNRDKVVLATKVTGRSENFPYYGRGEETRLDRANIEAAIDASLERLRTDYIDLYQLHWPDRKTNFFGQLGFEPDADDDAIPLLETLRVLDDLVKAGKIRAIGVSNETPWGLMRYFALAETHGLPRMMSIQNPYNVLNRTFEVGLAEIAWRERCGLLAYSPLGFGTLSGKYLDGALPAGARLTLYPHYGRYKTAAGDAAIRRYVVLARDHGLDPAQMALAYVNRRPFLTSTIIGATSLEQLADNIASARITLSEEVLTGIEKIHDDHPNPCP